jgi:hypothetical protein
MQNKDAAKWLQQKDVSERFKVELKHMVSFKKWLHNTIAFLVPLTFKPNSSVNVEEVQESNNLPVHAVTKAKWAKAPKHQTPTQSCSHLIISFSDPDTANQAILNRLIICNKRVTVQKCKKELLRCSGAMAGIM